MLDQFSIFTKAGALLWSFNYCKMKGNPVNELIKNVLLEVFLISSFFGTLPVGTLLTIFFQLHDNDIEMGICQRV